MRPPLNLFPGLDANGDHERTARVPEIWKAVGQLSAAAARLLALALFQRTAPDDVLVMMPEDALVCGVIGCHTLHVQRLYEELEARGVARRHGVVVAPGSRIRLIVLPVPVRVRTHNEDTPP